MVGWSALICYPLKRVKLIGPDARLATQASSFERRRVVGGLAFHWTTHLTLAMIRTLTLTRTLRLTLALTQTLALTLTLTLMFTDTDTATMERCRLVRSWANNREYAFSSVAVVVAIGAAGVVVVVGTHCGLQRGEGWCCGAGGCGPVL